MPFSVMGGGSLGPRETRIALWFGRNSIGAFLPASCMSVSWNILSLPLTTTRGRIEDRWDYPNLTAKDRHQKALGLSGFLNLLE